MTNKKIQKLIKFIGPMGGKTFTEIQRFICELEGLDPHKRNEFPKLYTYTIEDDDGNKKIVSGNHRAKSYRTHTVEINGYLFVTHPEWERLGKIVGRWELMNPPANRGLACGFLYGLGDTVGFLENCCKKIEKKYVVKATVYVDYLAGKRIYATPKRSVTRLGYRRIAGRYPKESERTYYDHYRNPRLYGPCDIQEME